MNNTLRYAALLLIGLFSVTTLPAQNNDNVSADKAVEYFQKGEWAKAAEAFAIVTEKQPNNVGAWFQMGFAWHSLGEYDKAIDSYAAILKFPPNALTALTMYNLSCSHALKGENDQALEWLNKAADAGFNQTAQVEADTDLDELREIEEFAAVREKIDRNARPCAYVEGARALDFWVGDWNVLNAAGQLVGTNRIENILETCVIAEHWTGTLGTNGRSFSTYDPNLDTWHQTWVDDKGSTNLFKGEMVDGSMVFRRESEGAGGATILTRMTLTPLENGNIRQLGENSIDDGENWNTTYDLTYVRKDSASGGS